MTQSIGKSAYESRQLLEVIERALERDNFLSAEEARDFGLIDEVVFERPRPPAEAS